MAEETQNTEVIDSPEPEADEIRMPKKVFNERLERAKRVAREEAVRTAQSEFYKSLGIDDSYAPEEIADKLRRAKELEELEKRREEEKAIERGEFSKFKAQYDTDIKTYKTRVAELEMEKDAEVQAANEKFNGYLVRQTLTSALVRAGIMPEVLDDVLASLTHPTAAPVKFHVGEDDQVELRDRNGELIPVEGGDVMSPERFISDYLKQRQTLLQPSLRKGAGTGGTMSVQSMTREEIRQKALESPEARADIMRKLRNK